MAAQSSTPQPSAQSSDAQNNNYVLLIAVTAASLVGSATCWWGPGGQPPASLAHAVLGILGIGAGWLFVQLLLDAALGKLWLPGGRLAHRAGLALLDLRHAACFALALALVWRPGLLAVAAGVVAWLSYRLALRTLGHRLAWAHGAEQ